MPRQHKLLANWSLIGWVNKCKGSVEAATEQVLHSQLARATECSKGCMSGLGFRFSLPGGQSAAVADRQLHIFLFCVHRNGSKKRSTGPLLFLICSWMVGSSHDVHDTVVVCYPCVLDDSSTQPGIGWNRYNPSFLCRPAADSEGAGGGAHAA